MTEAARTKEELFLARFAALPNSEEPIELTDVSIALQMNPKALKNIVRLLAQGNFIKKHGTAISLTPHGRRTAGA